MIDKNIVIELDKKIKTSGRSANAIALNKNAGRILSLDLQTNLIYGIISNLYGEILFEINKPIDNPEFSPYLDILLETIDELKTNTYNSTFGIIGIGIVFAALLNSFARNPSLEKQLFVYAIFTALLYSVVSFRIKKTVSFEFFNTLRG